MLGKSTDSQKMLLLENSPHDLQLKPVEETSKRAPSTSTSPPHTMAIVATPVKHNSKPCQRNCHCQCHVSTQVCTPKWAKDLLGSLIIRSNTTLLLNRKPCNYLGCGKSNRAIARFAYYAPMRLWNRAVYASVSRQAAFGMGVSISFAFPRLTPNKKIWVFIQEGMIDEVRSQIEHGAASIYDVGEDGESLLHVSGFINLRVTHHGPHANSFAMGYSTREGSANLEFANSLFSWELTGSTAPPTACT